MQYCFVALYTIIFASFWTHVQVFYWVKMSISMVNGSLSQYHNIINFDQIKILTEQIIPLSWLQYFDLVLPMTLVPQPLWRAEFSQQLQYSCSGLTKMNHIQLYCMSGPVQSLDFIISNCQPIFVLFRFIKGTQSKNSDNIKLLLLNSFWGKHAHNILLSLIKHTIIYNYLHIVIIIIIININVYYTMCTYKPF